MGYDANKDKTVAEKMIQNGLYKVSVHSYNGGEPKVQIGKETFIKDKDGKDMRVYTGKTGRLEVESARLIAEAILELTK